MKRDLTISILLGCIVITCGCAAAVIGVGVAAGVGASYVAGKDTRTYDAEYHQTVHACQETLNDLKMPVSRIEADESKTTILAKRADETPVTIEVVRAGTGRSEVGIRTGVIGISELEDSNRIHDALKESLGRKIHAPGEVAGASGIKTYEPEQPSETLTKPRSGRRTNKPHAIPLARRAPPELTIYFLRDSNELRPSEAAKLDKVAEALTQQPEASLTLTGYTDAAGSTDYNMMIAESRTSAVKIYLVAKGINPQRIAVIGKGARDFVASNDSEEGRKQNRRVEIKISGNR